MYIVARFDTEVSEEAREAVLESGFLSTILMEHYYHNPDGSIGVDQFQEDLGEANIMMAHDNRGPVTHASIFGAKLPKDVLYVYMARGAESFNTEELLKACITDSSYPWESDVQRDVAELIHTDISELAVNIGYPHRGRVMGIGEIDILCCTWGGDAGELYMKSMRVSFDEASQPEVSNDESSS